MKKLHTYPPMKMEQTECSEMLTYKIQTPGNYPEESIKQITIELIPRLIFCNIGGSDTTFAGDSAVFFSRWNDHIAHLLLSKSVCTSLPEIGGLKLRVSKTTGLIQDSCSNEA
jgi:hypothetical protein